MVAFGWEIYQISRYGTVLRLGDVPVTGPLPFLGAADQPSLDGVLVDVFELVPEIAHPPDDVVKISLLPDGAMDFSLTCNVVSRLTLQVPHDPNQTLLLWGN